MIIYLIGSLRNPLVPELGNALRQLGHDAFDDWHAAGPTADDEWQRYETERGRTYKEALRGHAAKHVFSFDLHHLNRADCAVLVLPAGKSGHTEFGYVVGQGKPAYVLFDEVPPRYDQMYQFAFLNGGDVFFDKQELLEVFKRQELLVSRQSIQ